jgi:FAD:protein FMN transferase
MRSHNMKPQDISPIVQHQALDGAHPHTTLRIEFSAMAAPCSVTVVSEDAVQAGAAMQAAMQEVRRIEAKYSRYVPGSIVSRINAAASKDFVEVDEETEALLQFAQTLFDQSDGLFDITSGVLRQAWDFKRGIKPTQVQLDAVLPLVGWDQVEFFSNQIRLPVAGMELDLGGFGKEYAADRACAMLQERGITHALVNLGGDVRALQQSPASPTPWLIGIAHPRNEGTVMANLPLMSGGLATSGDYERYFEQDGQRYCHILDPRTGWPVKHWQSISVVAALAVSAGSLSTIAMLKGVEALTFLDAQEAAYLAVDAQGQRHMKNISA